MNMKVIDKDDWTRGFEFNEKDPVVMREMADMLMSAIIDVSVSERPDKETMLSIMQRLIQAVHYTIWAVGLEDECYDSGE